MDSLGAAVRASRTGISLIYVDHREDGRILERGFYAMWRGARSKVHSTAQDALTEAIAAINDGIGSVHHK